MVDNLLDLLTGGEHKKTKRILEERRRLREEDERIRQMLEGKPVSMQGVPDDKVHAVPNQPDMKVDFDSLKSLTDCGIDMKFLETVGKYHKYLKLKFFLNSAVFIIGTNVSFIR